jgi:hypothetical protein
MKIHFKRSEVMKLLDHTISQNRFRSLYGEYKGSGLLLVGDQGVYLMSNAVKSLPGNKGKGNYVAYARECDPVKRPFDTWWANKNASFGGDDGVDFITSGEVRRALGGKGNLEIDMTPLTFSLTINPL